MREVFEGADVRLGRWIYGNTTPAINNFGGRLSLAWARLNAPRGICSSQLRRQFARDGIAMMSIGLIPATVVSTVARKFASAVEDDRFSQPFGEYPEALVEKTGRLFGRKIPDPRVIPEIEAMLTPDVRQFITACYGCHFKVVSVEAYRTYHVPADLQRTIDAYSNWWHCDQRPSDISKLMINLSHVGPEDGPFCVATRPTTARWLKDERFARFGRRIEADFQATGTERERREVVEHVGPPGAAMLCNTQLCLHKAGVPRVGQHRDLLQIVVAASADPECPDWLRSIDPDFGRRSRYRSPFSAARMS